MWITNLVKELPSYIQDTPDLLRHIETLNEKPIPDGAFPVSIDVTGLYSNIPHQEGLDCLKEALDTREDQSVPTSFLITLMGLVLMWNIFEFDLRLFIQIIGTAMGTRAAPTFACLFMGRVDIWIRKAAIVGVRNLIHFYKRFIDDILIIWTGTEEEFLTFIKTINTLHPTIKFTCEYNIQERSTTFLDTKITIINNRIETDLYRKPTDRVQYLLPRSSHPSHIFKNVPFSLALRLVRIVSQREKLLERLQELKAMLLSRDYRKNIVDAAIEKAKAIPREEALKK